MYNAFLIQRAMTSPLHNLTSQMISKIGNSLSFDMYTAKMTALVSVVLLALLFSYDALATQTMLSNIIKSLAMIGLFISAVKLFTPSRTLIVADDEQSETKHVPAPTLKRDIQEEEKTDTFDLEDKHDDSLQSLIEPNNQNIHVEKDEIVLHVDQNDTQHSYYSELIVALKNEENKERGAKQKEFFSHQNDAEDREYLGVNISKIVGFAETFQDKITLDEVDDLLDSSVHEHRIVGVWILVKKYQHADDTTKKAIVEFYVERREKIDNWDMTDLAARNIIGAYIHEFQEADVLATLIESDSLWDKRSALMATHTSISNGETSLGLFVMDKVHHIQDELVQSAIGWVLKELFKQDKEPAVEFMMQHFSSLSKQALRIGTERMEKDRRKAFLRGEFEEVTA